MPNYNEAQGVADLLSKFDFNIISEGPGDFSTQHRKYTCEFSKPGIESFTTTSSSARAPASTSMRRACSPARPTARCTRPRAWKRPGTSP